MTAPAPDPHGETLKIRVSTPESRAAESRNTDPTELKKQRLVSDADVDKWAMGFVTLLCLASKIPGEHALGAIVFFATGGQVLAWKHGKRASPALALVGFMPAMLKAMASALASRSMMLLPLALAVSLAAPGCDFMRKAWPTIRTIADLALASCHAHAEANPKQLGPLTAEQWCEQADNFAPFLEAQKAASQQAQQALKLSAAPPLVGE